MNRRFFLTTVAALAMAVAPGCQTTRESCAPVSCFPPYTGPTPGEAPCERCRQPLFGPRIAPTPVTVAPPAVSAFPAAPAASAYFDPSPRSPFDPGVRLAAPIPDDPYVTHNSTSLYPDPMPQPPPALQAPVPDEKDAASPLPVDVPQFTVVKDRVASGLQPFPDGIAWLQTHGYRTVLHIRAPGEDDSAARRQFEKRGLRYLSLEVSPNTLSRNVVEEFNLAVMDEASLPLFVYDRDGVVAGGLWYLYYRTAEKASDERARSEAARLGFLPDEGGEQRTMWIAVQRYLSMNP